MFENNRVKFYMQTEVSELREQDGKVLYQWQFLWTTAGLCAKM